MKNSVIVLFIFSICFSCTKKKNSTPGSLPRGAEYTSGMGGSRYWHGTNQDIGQHSRYDTVNSTYVVTVVNDTTIAFSFLADDMLHFVGWDSTDKKIMFLYSSNLIPTQANINYYYDIDSLSFYFYCHVGAGDNQYVYLSTQ